jgi:hypothetical protein
VEYRVGVIKNRVVRRTFGPKRDKVTGDCRRLHNEELYDLYSSPNIVWVMKSGRIRWEGCVACMGDTRGAYRVLVGRPEGNRPLGRLGIGGRITLKWIFKKWNGGDMDWTDLTLDWDKSRALVNLVMTLQVP